MTTPLELAFPLGSNWPAATVRSKLAEAMIGVFSDPDLSGENFTIQPYPAIAIRGNDGDLVLYAFDAADTVTADDGGATCIVVSGRRYKRSTELIVKDAALSAETTAQPVSPTLGDTYIVPAAPSGDDWASQAKTVATFTARGWIFRQAFVGMIVYVEDEDGFYHYDSGGDWISGLPIGAIPDGSIPPKKLTHPFMILKVEAEQNSPPGSPPTTGTMYLIGVSPTGAWVGHSRDVAVWNGSSYEFLEPSGDGDMLFNRDDSRLYTYVSGIWAPAGNTGYRWQFDSSGTWDRPPGLSDDAIIRVRNWAAGGGGGSGGNGAGSGGGCYREAYFRVGDLTSSVTVTVGVGGAVGNAGGNTSFGAYLIAYGGGAGGSTGGGGGGGYTSAGSNGSTSGGAGGGPSFAAGLLATAGQGSSSGAAGVGGGGGGTSGADRHGGDAIDGGGGGGGSNLQNSNGGKSVNGGGGGGSNTSGLGGISIYGGNGGDAGQPGAVPGGGGGRNAAGGNGRCIIEVVG